MPAKKKAEEVKEEIKAAETKAEKAVKTKARKVADDVKKAPAKAKAAAKKAAMKNEVIIQSPMGGVITPAEILAKTGPVDSVYVRVDENKAYWVKGEETGSVDLW